MCVFLSFFDSFFPFLDGSTHIRMVTKPLKAALVQRARKTMEDGPVDSVCVRTERFERGICRGGREGRLVLDNVLVLDDLSAGHEKGRCYWFRGSCHRKWEEREETKSRIHGRVATGMYVRIFTRSVFSLSSSIDISLAAGDEKLSSKLNLLYTSLASPRLQHIMGFVVR